MMWTKEPPTEPGWYWWREDATRLPYPRHVRHDGDGVLYVIGYQFPTVAEYGGEWQGPIAPQEGAE
jgi:hypothetical protein